MCEHVFVCNFKFCSFGIAWAIANVNALILEHVLRMCAAKRLFAWGPGRWYSGVCFDMRWFQYCVLVRYCFYVSWLFSWRWINYVSFVVFGLFRRSLLHSCVSTGVCFDCIQPVVFATMQYFAHRCVGCVSLLIFWFRCAAVLVPVSCLAWILLFRHARVWFR